jgi:hypothetical protein
MMIMQWMLLPPPPPPLVNDDAAGVAARRLDRGGSVSQNARSYLALICHILLIGDYVGNFSRSFLAR